MIIELSRVRHVAIFGEFAPLRNRCFQFDGKARGVDKAGLHVTDKKTELRALQGCESDVLRYIKKSIG